MLTAADLNRLEELRAAVPAGAALLTLPVLDELIVLARLGLTVGFEWGVALTCPDCGDDHVVPAVHETAARAFAARHGIPSAVRRRTTGPWQVAA